MTWSDELYTFITTHGTNPFGTRVYPRGEMPRTPPSDPYLTFEKVTSRHIRHLGGGSELAATQFDLRVYARRQRDSDTNAAIVKDMLDNRHHEDWSGTTMYGAFVDDTDESHLPPDDDSKRATFISRLTVTIWHGENATPIA